MALMTAFEAGSRWWLLGTHLLSRGWPQGCHQCLGVFFKDVGLEFGFLFKPCLVASFGVFFFFPGVVNLNGHFYQVSELGLRPILSLGEFFFFFLMSEADWDIKRLARVVTPTGESGAIRV